MIKYSTLRHKPKIELSLFVLTAGLLAYFGESSLWYAFWATFAVGFGLTAVLLYIDSEAFRQHLSELQAKEFRLATTLNKCGADDVFLMGDPGDQASRNIQTRHVIETGFNFSLLTLTAASYIDPAVDRHWETLKARLDIGASLRLLVQDPFSAEKRVRDRRNRPDGGLDSKLDLGSMIRLAEAYDSVSIRVAGVNIYAAVFFSESLLTYDPYHLGMIGQRIENRFICLSYHRLAPKPGGSDDHYSLLVDHFNFLWNDCAVTLKDFLRSERERLEEWYGRGILDAVDRHLGLQHE